jgi:UDPglucose 6-dehydrogenase
MKIAVIGTGYVGLVAGAGFADMGSDVVCADIDAAKIAMLKRGEIPIYEPGLEKLIAHNVREGRLSFTTDVPAAVAGSEVIFLAVGTPPLPDGSADLSYTSKAAETVARALTGFAVIVTKSTVPVGTGDKIEEIARKHARCEFAVASNPEFLKEGDAVGDFLKPDRIIVGTSDARAIATLQALYAPFTRSSDRMLVMDRRSAELTKYAANSMLATRISFMNDLANLCDAVGADIECVRKGMGSDARIGTKFLYAGVGFGGSCFPKDLRAAINTGNEVGVPLACSRGRGRRQRRAEAPPGRGHPARTSTATSPASASPCGVWRSSQGTDDIREAPALVVAEDLLAAGAEVVATDPVAIPAAQKLLGQRVRFATSNYACAEGADALRWSPSGATTAVPISSVWPASCAARRCSTGATSGSPPRCAPPGSTYYGIGRRTATVSLLAPTVPVFSLLSVLLRDRRRPSARAPKLARLGFLRICPRIAPEPDGASRR